MDQAIVEKFSPEKFSRYWPMIEQELKTVHHIWDDIWTLESIFEATVHGRFQCWGAGDLDHLKVVCWTQIATYPNGNVLQIFLAIGNGIDELLPVLDASMESFARSTECKLIEVVGRKGWQGKLRSMGFVPWTTSVKREVTDTRVQ